MRLFFAFVAFAALLGAASCNDSSHDIAHDDAAATIASETGVAAPLPDDVLYSSKALISGKLYARPSFDGTVLAHFDTLQQLHIIDTTGGIFVKARLLHNSSAKIGYVPKAILPERQP
ncbi:hypothetical protein [Pontibacter russatus]|uniref:hypothetical protein n=1 Tax=Pontibacter russatus TaxID=2694929 RepID=UPI00137972D5|nr:hypothetical protein [Pontibacter russatus]